ncbi:MAG: formylglycine-generating enzyme family protein [Pseudanabaena sp.]
MVLNKFLLFTFYFLLVCLFAIAPPVFAANSCLEGMVFIHGGTFRMGSDSDRFPEEKAADNVSVSSFCMDQHEITNAEFAKFVKATGYKTIAEIPLSKEEFPDLPDEQRLAGSLVFQPPKEDTQQVPFLSWWSWTVGANWRHPFGKDSSIKGKDNYPVVHIAYKDAEAYAKWIGKSIPTEAQWEYAARGGLDGATYAWGDQYSEKRANTWQGVFPFFNTKADGYKGLAPVGSFPPNGYGLYDMTGNVWEWTSDFFEFGHDRMAYQRNPIASDHHKSFDPKKPDESVLHVIKGGSYLCAPNYCSRYRPAARESESPDTGTTHIGFRLVLATE